MKLARYFAYLQVHPLIRFLLRSRVDEKCADLHKLFISCLFLVGVTVQSAEALSAANPLGTSTKRANSKRANHGQSCFFQEAVSSVSFWLRSCTIHRCPRGQASVWEVRRPASSLSPTTHFAKSSQYGIPPHAPLASPVWDPGSSVRMPQNSPPSVTSTLTPFHCTTTGTSIVPLELLAQRLRRGSRCPACLAGSRAQFDSAMRFSSPDDLPSSTVFSRPRWQYGMPLFCARGLLSSWKRMQSSRSLQPRWGRGFTALTSSYPRKVVAFDQSWICESWTGLYTSSRSRCGRAGALWNASSPRIGLQRSSWRMLTFTFRSFYDTDRSYGLRWKVGHGSTGSSVSGSPCLPVCSRRS